jgi:formyltetrahydrofolate deformylase
MSCPDACGIISSVSGFISDHGGWIDEASYHSDPSSQWFFMRQAIRAESLDFDEKDFSALFSPIADRFNIKWRIWDTGRKKRVVVLASREDHCVNELVHRAATGDGPFEIVSILSNHENLRSFVEWNQIPFHHIPVDPKVPQKHFSEISRLFSDYRGDVMVLARYMRILPESICNEFSGRILNIHHSFLPSFAGARPYHQAFLRGVKLIGATCHYVTAELDAGPIIEQDVIRIDHGDSPEVMARLGRYIEKLVLAKGLRYHAEDRVLIHDSRTIVFH